MDTMIGTVTPNSMIIRVNVTIQKSMVARSGSNVVAVQIVRQDLQVRRDRLVREVLSGPKVFLESEVR